MNRGQKTIVSMLGVVAVLLALNLAGGKSWAFASGGIVGPTGATVVAGQSYQLNNPGPDHHPTSSNMIVRFWSDGSVDSSVFSLDPITTCNLGSQCGPVTILPASCAADFSPPDGIVNIQDLLGLLAEWGACPTLAME